MDEECASSIRSSPKSPFVTIKLGHIPSPIHALRTNVVESRASRVSARRFPPRYKLPTVSIRQANKKVANIEYKDKVIGWDEATNHRPPLKIDMDGPTPWTYTPRNKPLKETNSPCWSFGKRTFVEKAGGSRTAWEKTWFQQPNIWIQKTDFLHDSKWPSPVHYKQRAPLGRSQHYAPEAPQFSIGNRREKGNETKENNPPPNQYDVKTLCRSAPAFTLGSRNNGTILLPMKGDSTPAPGTYNPNQNIVKTKQPRYSVIGYRREKTHEYGPFATL